MHSLLKVKTLFEFELWTEILYFYGKQIKYFEMKKRVSRVVKSLLNSRFKDGISLLFQSLVFFLLTFYNI